MNKDEAQMMVFPHMLVFAAASNGIVVPSDDEVTKCTWKPREYPQWHILCITQMHRTIEHNKVWENARIISTLPIDKIASMNRVQAAELGLCPAS